MNRLAVALAAVLALWTALACAAFAADGGEGMAMVFPKLYNDSGDGSVPRAYAQADGADVPTLHVDKTEATLKETITLSWNEPKASQVNLFVLRDDSSDYEFVFTGGPVDTYQTTLEDCYHKVFCFMAVIGEEFRQSNNVDIWLNESTAPLLRARGYNNVWNVLALIYPNVDAPTLKASWDKNAISQITTCIRKLPQTVSGLSNGLMQIGQLNILRMDEPITSISNADGSLTYGEGGDVNFNYLFDHLDVQLVIVYAPLGFDGITWAGLGGGWISYNGNDHYNIIVQYYDTTWTSWARNGISYSVPVCCVLHETLHAVETNSRRNGWAGFTGLHDSEEQGYKSDPLYDWLDWYGDLMADTLKTGAPGFREESYLVKHRRIRAKMKQGIHEDSDGRLRIYTNGLPDRSVAVAQYEGEWMAVQNGELIRYAHTLNVPNGLREIDAEAFSGVSAQWIQLNEQLETVGSRGFAGCADLRGVVIPRSVSWIAPDAFADCPRLVLYAIENPYVEQYASENGLAYVVWDGE